tara:strand:+ start:160 stop:1131 length:972 start_codon:yes stop_codon:yes gene_type:complete
MKKKEINVLSLFDGMSCGRIALERTGIEVDNYFSSEVDKYAIQIADKNYPQDTINRLGDVCDIDTSRLPKIDFLIGGSPCQGFSMAGKLKGSSTSCGKDVTTLEHYLVLKEMGFSFDGQSYLFWEYVRILTELRKVNPYIKFMLENVRITKKWLPMFNEAMGVEPIIINSSLLSAQNRVRYYWTNIDNINQPKDKGLVLSDIVENIYKCGNLRMCELKDFDKKSVCHHIANATDIKGNESIKRVYAGSGKSPTITTCAGGHREPKILNGSDTYRKLTPLECERLQTVPDNYTLGVSNSQRYKMIGNGWTVDVISHIFRNIILH